MLIYCNAAVLLTTPVISDGCTVDVLQQFCRQHSIKQSGQKKDILSRLRECYIKYVEQGKLFLLLLTIFQQKGSTSERRRDLDCERDSYGTKSNALSSSAEGET